MIITTEESNKVLSAVEDEIVETKRLRWLAEFYILNFDSEVEAYKARKQEFLVRQMDDNSGIRGNGPGRPTESYAMKSIKFDECYKPLRWLKVVEILRKSLGERKSLFIQARVEAERRARDGRRGRPAWVGYTRDRYAEELEKRFLVRECCSDATIRNLWHGIVARAIAIYRKVW